MIGTVKELLNARMRPFSASQRRGNHCEGATGVSSKREFSTTSSSSAPLPQVLLRCLLAAAFLLALLSAALAPQPKYLLVIDAGSSGTRIHAYAWRPPSSPRNPLPSLAELSSSASEAGARRRRRSSRLRDGKGGFANRKLIPGGGAERRRRRQQQRRPVKSRDAFDRVETSPGLEQWYRGGGGRYAESDPRSNQETKTPSARVAAALEPLLSWADDALPPPPSSPSALASCPPVPVLFVGTAGLRRLPREEKEGVLKAVGAAIEGWRREEGDDGDNGDDEEQSQRRQRQRFFAAIPPRIAAGADEAAYAWAARAYTSGKLAKRAAAAASPASSSAVATRSPPSSRSKRSAGGETEAVLDLGGSSLEVAFAEEEEGGQEAGGAGGTRDGPTSSSSETRHISLGDGRGGRGKQVIRLHASSHAGLGLDDAFLASVERLLRLQQRKEGKEERTGGGDGGAPLSSSSSSSSSSPVLKLPKALAAALHVGGSDSGSSGDIGSTSDHRYHLPRLPHAPPLLFGSLEGASAATASADDGEGDGRRRGGAAAAAAVVRHPCLGPGRETALQLPEATARPSSPSSSSTPPTTKVRVVGDPHWGRCAALARSLVPRPTFNSSYSHVPRQHHQQQQQQARSQQELPSPRPLLPPLPPDSPVAALSGFAVVHSRFGLGTRDGPGKLLQAARRECSERWSLEEERGIEREEEEERREKEIEDDKRKNSGSSLSASPVVAEKKADEERHVDRTSDRDDDIDDDVFCFRAAYAAALLRDGFGLSPPRLTVQSASGRKRGTKNAVAEAETTPSPSSVFFLLEQNKRKAHPKHAGWPLGAALLEGSTMLEAVDSYIEEKRVGRGGGVGGKNGDASGNKKDARAKLRSLSAFGSAAASLGALAAFLREHGCGESGRTKARNDDELASSRRKSCTE